MSKPPAAGIAEPGGSSRHASAASVPGEAWQQSVIVSSRHSRNPTPTPPTANRLEADAKALAGELDELQQQRVDTPTHVRAGNLSEQDKLDALPVGERLFMEVVRMIAYRAETRMMAPVIGAQGKKPNARRLLRALLTSDANIIPEPAQHILRIQPLGLGSDACDRMLAPLIEELNATRTIYPGTQLRLVYEMAADSSLDVSSDSGWRSGSLKLPRTRASPRPDGRRHSLGGRRTVRADRCHEAGAEDG